METGTSRVKAGSETRHGLFGAEAVSAEIDEVLEGAMRWLTCFARPRLTAFDPDALTLCLLGLGCAWRVLPPSRMRDAAEVALQTSAALAQSLGDSEGEARACFHSGGAVTFLLAAALMPEESESASAFREACLREWLALTGSGVLRPSSSAWRMGNHLQQVLRGTGAPATAPSTSLLSAASLVPAHALTSDIVQDLATEVALLSGFGGSRLGSEWEPLGRVLGDWAFFYTKKRDLDLLCPVLRALRYASLADRPEYEEGIRFVLDHAEQDGRFSAQGLAIHLQNLVSDNPFDTEREVHLRLTAASVWTLLEHVLPQSPLALARPGTAVRDLSREREGFRLEDCPIERSELVRQASGAQDSALDWIERHLEWFNPLTHRDTRRMEYVIKAASELALLCDLTARGARHTTSARVARIAEYLWEEVFQHTALQEFLLAKPASLPTFSLYSSLRQCGFEDLRYRRRLERILDEGYITAAENGPAIELDLVYSVAKAGLAWTGESASSVYRRSLFAHHPRLLPLSDMDVYAFTHTIFFLTEFGAVTPSCFSTADFSYARNALPRLLSYYLTCSHWDLAGELLMAAVEMDALPEPLFGHAWVKLLSGQDRQGSFPGPVVPTAEAPKLDQEQEPALPPGDAETTWRRFADDYHTTLVALLAIRTVLSP